MMLFTGQTLQAAGERVAAHPDRSGWVVSGNVDGFRVRAGRRCRGLRLQTPATGSLGRGDQLERAGLGAGVVDRTPEAL